MIAELDGRPVAFMLTFPDLNDALAKIKGKLFPFGWIHMFSSCFRPMTGSGAFSSPTKARSRSASTSCFGPSASTRHFEAVS